MSRYFSRKAVAMLGAFLCLGLWQLSPASAQTRKAGELSAEELRHRVQELEAENAELRGRLEHAIPQEKPAVSIGEVEQEAPETAFLKLGERKDYLKAERYRIIEQIETFIPPLFEPLRPFHGFTLPPRAGRISLSTGIFNNNGNFGRDDDYSFFFKDVRVRNLSFNTDISYGFELPYLSDLVASLNIPYRRTSIRGGGHPFRIKTIGMTMQGDSEGLGDMSLTVKKKWLEQGNYYVDFATMLGVIFPTGQHREEFNDAQTLFVNGVPLAVSGRAGGPRIDAFGANNGSRCCLIPTGSQPGTGAWGGRIGFGITRQFQFMRGSLHGGVIYDFFADNADGIEPGNELKFGVSYVSPILRSDRLALDLSFFGQDKAPERFPGRITHPVRDPNDPLGGPIMDPVTGMPKLFTTKRPAFRHGTVAFLSPSLIFVPTPMTRLIASPAFRVLEPQKGPSPDFRLDVSLTHTFDLPLLAEEEGIFSFLHPVGQFFKRGG